MTNTPLNTGTVDDHHHIWPLWYILGGLAVGFGWLWGNTVQIQTSEAWILQFRTGIDLIPHFAILLQIADFFNGNLTQSQVIADTWGLPFWSHCPETCLRNGQRFLLGERPGKGNPDTRFVSFSPTAFPFCR